MDLLPSPVCITNVDGTENSAGEITHSCTLILSLPDFSQLWTFQVTCLHDADIYIGLDWLHHFNPSIDWQSLSIETYPIRFSSSLPTEVPPEYSTFAQVFTEEEFNKFLPE